MNRCFFLLIFGLSFLVLQGQNSAGGALLPEQQFLRLSKPIDHPSQEPSRLAELNHQVTRYSFSSFQVKKLCEMFISENARLTFAMAVYPKVTDKDHFFQVYDAFGYFSSVMQLYDFIKKQELPQSGTPGLIYPDCQNYTGQRNCASPIPFDDFAILYDQAKALNGDQIRMPYVVSVVRSNCVAVSHVMKLASLLVSENLRLDLVKQSFPGLYDVANLEMAHQLFQQPRVKEAFGQFVTSTRPTQGFDPLPPVAEPPVCEVTEADFSAMMASLQKQSFNNTRISMARQMLAAGKCFSVTQISEMVRSFSFESAKLEIAKYAWDYCSQKEKYYAVADVFDYESSKTELMTFLKQK